MRKKIFDLQQEIISRIKKYNAELVYYDFNYRAFGNTIVKIVDRNGIEHEFILDRSTIYIDNKTIIPCINTDPKFPDKRHKVLLGCILYYLSKT